MRIVSEIQIYNIHESVYTYSIHNSIYITYPNPCVLILLHPTCPRPDFEHGPMLLVVGPFALVLGSIGMLVPRPPCDDRWHQGKTQTERDFAVFFQAMLRR